MKKLAFVMLVSLVLALIITIPASASPSIAVSGSLPVGAVFSETFTPKGGVCIVNLDAMLEFRDENGGMNAVIVGDAHTQWIIVGKYGGENPCEGAYPGKSDETWTAKGTFEGTVNGIAGSFDFNYNARVKEGGQFTAKLNIGQGYGGLANLHGGLNETGDILGQNSYTGRIHFD